MGDDLGKMKNVLADSNYTIENDAQYFIKKGFFLRENVYSLIPFQGDPIIKFYGLNKAYCQNSERIFHIFIKLMVKI